MWEQGSRRDNQFLQKSHRFQVDRGGKGGFRKEGGEKGMKQSKLASLRSQLTAIGGEIARNAGTDKHR